MTVIVEIQTGTDTDQQWDRIPEGSRVSYGIRPMPSTAISDSYAYEKPSDRERFARFEVQFVGHRSRAS